MVVTGGGAGIGRAIAIAVANARGTLAVIDVDEEGLSTLGRELVALGSKQNHVFFVGDATAGSDVDAFLERVTSTGIVWGLVNNVGGAFSYTPTVDLDDQEFDATLSLNLRTAFVFSRAVARLMLESGGGRIVNIASIVAERALPGLAAYSIAKAGVLALTRTMAVELAPANVFVNAVAPGHIVTATAMRVVPEAVRAGRDAVIPTGKQGTPEDIARSVVFLLADATWLTGAVLTVDGGHTAALPRPLPNFQDPRTTPVSGVAGTRIQ